MAAAPPSIPPALPPASVCTNCGLVSRTPPIFIKSNIPYLSHCSQCDQSIDQYVEYDWVILILSFLLLRLSLYIHLAYNRLTKTPITKLIAISLLWLAITTFGFSLAAEKSTLVDTLSFIPQVHLSSIQYDPILSLPTSVSSQIPPSDAYMQLPSTPFEHCQYLYSLLTHGLPTFTLPPNFIHFFLLDITGFCFLTVILPLFIHLRYNNEKNHPTMTSVGLYRQTVASFIRCLITGLAGRGFLLISFAFDIDSRVYFSVQIVYALITLTIALCTFFHIAPGFYSLDTNKTTTDGITATSSSAETKTKTTTLTQFTTVSSTPVPTTTTTPTNSYQPNLHQTDLFSFWNNTTPVLILALCYIIPLTLTIIHLQPDFDLGLSWFVSQQGL